MEEEADKRELHKQLEEDDDQQVQQAVKSGPNILVNRFSSQDTEEESKNPIAKEEVKIRQNFEINKLNTGSFKSFSTILSAPDQQQIDHLQNLNTNLEFQKQELETQLE